MSVPAVKRSFNAPVPPSLWSTCQASFCSAARPRARGTQSALVKKVGGSSGEHTTTWLLFWTARSLLPYLFWCVYVSLFGRIFSCVLWGTSPEQACQEINGCFALSTTCQFRYLIWEHVKDCSHGGTWGTLRWLFWQVVLCSNRGRRVRNSQSDRHRCGETYRHLWERERSRSGHEDGESAGAAGELRMQE